jgi:hypothetical protein
MGRRWFLLILGCKGQVLWTIKYQNGFWAALSSRVTISLILTTHGTKIHYKFLGQNIKCQAYWKMKQENDVRTIKCYPFIKDRWYKQTFFQNHENNKWSRVYIDKVNNFDHANFNFSFNFSQKWQIKWLKFVWTYIGNWRKFTNSYNFRNLLFI